MQTLIITNLTNYHYNSFCLIKPLFYHLFPKRFMFSRVSKIGHLHKILSSVKPNNSVLVLPNNNITLSYIPFNHKKKQNIWLYNISKKFQEKYATNYAINHPAYLNKQNIISNLSGLLNIPPEYYQKDVVYQNEFKKLIIISYMKVLYTLGKNNITSDEKLIKNIGNFFFTVNELFYNMKNNAIFHQRFMAITQHILVSLFLNKKLSLDLFSSITKLQIDFSQYETGNILLLIETHVLARTLGELSSGITFTAINPESPLLNSSLYDKQLSIQKTGQMHCDWFGMNKNKDLSLYKDVKMYESGASNGRLTLRPELFYNKGQLISYITKYSTSLQQYIKQHNITDSNHIIFKTLAQIDFQETIILRVIRPFLTNVNKRFLNENNVKEAIKLVEEFNTIILKMIENTPIANIINFGISADPGIDDKFIVFFKQNLETILQHINIDEEMLQILFNSKFDKEEHRKYIQSLLEYFPTELKNGIINALSYIDEN